MAKKIKLKDYVPRVCSLKHAKALSKYTNIIPYPNLWYYVKGIKNPVVGSMVPTDKKSWPTYTLGELVDILKVIPVNWQYMYSKGRKLWLLSDYHQTYLVTGVTFEDTVAEMLYYILSNKMFKKLSKQTHETLNNID